MKRPGFPDPGSGGGPPSYPNTYSGSPRPGEKNLDWIWKVGFPLLSKARVYLRATYEIPVFISLFSLGPRSNQYFTSLIRVRLKCFSFLATGVLFLVMLATGQVVEKEGLDRFTRNPSSFFGIEFVSRSLL